MGDQDGVDFLMRRKMFKPKRKWRCETPIICALCMKSVGHTETL